MDMAKNNSCSEDFVLAMYDVRGKQDYIYRSTHIKEIIGGSAIIRDIFKTYLYGKNGADKLIDLKTDNGAQIKNLGIYVYKKKEQFSIENFKKRIEEGYIGEVVYDGGGNFLVLYKNEEICKKITYIFTREVIKATATLKVICTYIKNLDFDNYTGESKRLYAEHRKNEAIMHPAIPYFSLPISQVDYHTSMPIIDTIKVSGVDRQVTRESKAKYEKYIEENERMKGTENEVVFDNIVEKRGEESLLAVIYVDGNNMGARVQNATGGKSTDYDTVVNSLRELSEEIQANFIDERLKEIDEYLYRDSDDKKKKRYVIYAGDEITFVCNPKDAFAITKLYLQNLPDKYTSCAGIAIFHSHTPYNEAYRIAEECCESGKKRMKELGVHDISYVDFHYCQGAIGTSLDAIRDLECDDVISKPWVVYKDKKDEEIVRRIKEAGDVSVEDVEHLAALLKILGRSNVKGLAEYAKRSVADFNMEINRIRAHMKEHKENERIWDYFDEMPEVKRKNLIYDMVIVYDLWFRDKDNGGGEKNEK